MFNLPPFVRFILNLYYAIEQYRILNPSRSLYSHEKQKEAGNIEQVEFGDFSELTELLSTINFSGYKNIFLNISLYLLFWIGFFYLPSIIKFILVMITRTKNQQGSIVLKFILTKAAPIFQRFWGYMVLLVFFCINLLYVHNHPLNLENFASALDVFITSLLVIPILKYSLILLLPTIFLFTISSLSNHILSRRNLDKSPIFIIIFVFIIPLFIWWHVFTFQIDMYLPEMINFILTSFLYARATGESVNLHVLFNNISNHPEFFVYFPDLDPINSIYRLRSYQKTQEVFTATRKVILFITTYFLAIFGAVELVNKILDFLSFPNRIKKIYTRFSRYISKIETEASKE